MTTVLLGSLASSAGAGVAESIALGHATLPEVLALGDELDVLEGETSAPVPDVEPLREEIRILKDLIKTDPNDNAWAIRVRALRFAELHRQLGNDERSLFADFAARADVLLKSASPSFAPTTQPAEEEKFTAGAIVRIEADKATDFTNMAFQGVAGIPVSTQAMMRLRAARRDQEIVEHKLLGEQSVWDDAKMAFRFSREPSETSSWVGALEYIGAFSLMIYLGWAFDNVAVSWIEGIFGLVGFPLAVGKVDGYRPFDKLRGDRAKTPAEAGKFYERGKFHLLAAGAYKRAAQEIQEGSPVEAAKFYWRAGNMYLNRRLGNHALYAYFMGLSLLDENENEIALELIDRIEKVSLPLESQAWVRSLRWERLRQPQSIMWDRLLLAITRNEISLARELEKMEDFFRAAALYLDALDHLSGEMGQLQEAADLRKEVLEKARQAVLKFNPSQVDAVSPRIHFEEPSPSTP